MNFKTTIVLIVLAGLTAGVYFLGERERPSTDDLKKSSKRVLRDFKTEDVVRVEIARAASPTATIVAAREKGGPWRIEAPIATEAEDGAVDALLSSASYADRKDALADFDPAALGLDVPRVRVSFTMADGSKRTVAFGSEDPTGRHIYAQVDGAGDALLVPKYTETGMAKELFDLREKRLFKAERWLVDRVTLQGPSMTLRFRKDGDYWLLDTGSASDYADKERMEALLGALTDLRAKKFLDDAEHGLPVYGLAPAFATVTLEAKGVTHTAQLGDRVAGPVIAGAKPEIYARRLPGGPVVTVPDEISDKVVWSVDHWRSRKLFHLGRDRAQTIEVRQPGTDAPAVRLERDPLGKWRFASPVTATADEKATDDLVRALEELMVSKVAAADPKDLANFGLDKPVVVTVETPKVKQTVRVGREAAKGDSYYVQREGRDDVYEATFPLAETLRNAWPMLRERRLVEAVAEDVTRIDLEKPGEEPRVFVRKPDGVWSAPPAGGADKGAGREVDGEVLDEMAAKLAALEASKVLSTPADPHLLGLKSPWLTVRVKIRAAAEGAPARDVVLELGKATAERERNARLTAGGETIYVVVSEELVNALERDPIEKPAPAPAPEAPTATAAPAAAAPAPATGTAQ